MKTTLRTERGIALIELALIMAFTVIVVLGVCFVSRALWHAFVLHKAAHQAARMVAAMPEEVFRNSTATTVIPAAAKRIFLDVATEAGLENVPVAGGISVLCDEGACNIGVPQRVQVTVQMLFTDTLFGGKLVTATGLQPVVAINAVAKVPYVRE